MEAAPGINMPMASIAEAMVFAVNIPEQAPSPGQATRSIAINSSKEICRVENAPTASYISCTRIVTRKNCTSINKDRWYV